VEDSEDLLEIEVIEVLKLVDIDVIHLNLTDKEEETVDLEDHKEELVVGLEDKLVVMLVNHLKQTV